LSKPVGGDSKITNKESFDRAAKQLKKDPLALYDLPKIKPEYLYLLKWFHQLKSDGPLKFSEIESWSRLTNKSPNCKEIDILMRLDSVFIEAQNNA